MKGFGNMKREKLKIPVAEEKKSLSYCLDALNNKVYLGDIVSYQGTVYEVKDFQYLKMQMNEQFIKLQSPANPRKVLDFIKPIEVLKTYSNKKF